MDIEVDTGDKVLFLRPRPPQLFRRRTEVRLASPGGEGRTSTTRKQALTGSREGAPRAQPCRSRLLCFPSGTLPDPFGIVMLVSEQVPHRQSQLSRLFPDTP